MQQLRCLSHCFTFRNHHLLPRSRYLEECAESLAADPQYPTDALLGPWVKVITLGEEVFETFDHGSRERVGELNDDKIQLLVTTLVRKLDEMEATLPPLNSDTGK